MIQTPPAENNFGDGKFSYIHISVSTGGCLSCARGEQKLIGNLFCYNSHSMTIIHVEYLCNFHT
jgi:hypothetical protein